MNEKRREFLKRSAAIGIGIGFAGTSSPLYSINPPEKMNAFFEISLAQWSLHKALFNKKLDNLDFALKAKNDFGISAVEYVNQFFADKAKDMDYLKEMKKRTDDNGITNVLIMIDREGALGDENEAERIKAVENHYKWVEAAKFLGCHSIRVNARGQGEWDDIATAAIDGLGRLSTFAKDHNINVIVENHGGSSSNGAWLANVIKQVGMDNCGTLPDLGNFCIKRTQGGCEESYDRYLGVKELMPYAKGVSAKTYDFDENGDCIETDYYKMMKIIKDAGYTGHIGIEYEGRNLSEEEGIKKTVALLKKSSKGL